MRRVEGGVVWVVGQGVWFWGGGSVGEDVGVYLVTEFWAWVNGCVGKEGRAEGVPAGKEERFGQWMVGDRLILTVWKGGGGSGH
jgi:poly(3-hydroxybutyrate) depolymerase